jgi:tungstate transport system ATP-binding protein
MISPHFQLTAIQVWYEKILALDVDELSISRGELHILAGPNGSGKSTLLGILAFLTKPASGQLVFDRNQVGWNPKELFALRKRVTLLHQESYLFSGNVFANVAFGLKVRGIKREQVRRAVERCLAMVALAGFENRKVRHLSGGEARRVALARALACEPEVLLLDEPLAHVDKETSTIIEQLITSRAVNGTTIVLSSHDERIGERLKGRVVHLLEGRIERTKTSTQQSELSS